MLFGTDATYFGDRHHDLYERRLVRGSRKALSRVELPLVLRGNAERLFGLAPPTDASTARPRPHGVERTRLSYSVSL